MGKGIRSSFGVVALALVGALVVGCGSDSSPTASSNIGSATGASPTAAPYAGSGPYAVGYTQLHLADGRRVVVWYPSRKRDVSGHPQQVVDLGSFLSPQLQAQIPAAMRVTYPASAYESAMPDRSNAPYPIVLFSHGYAGYPEQSVTLTTHLASWGFVVAAPDHVERSLDGLLGTASAGVAKSTDTHVLRRTLEAVDAESAKDGLLEGMADPKRVAVAGHSAGAGAAYELASQDPQQIKAFISYSVGFGDPESGPAPAAPKMPGMVMLGTTDGIIDPAASRQVYAGMKAPKYLVQISKAGHLVFSDICLIGRSSGGVTGIAQALKLPIPPELLKLGTDGCTADHPPPETAFPAIDQLSVAFLRSALRIDPRPVGLDTAAVAKFGAGVTVTHSG